MNDQNYEDLKAILSAGRIPAGYTGQKIWNFKYPASREFAYKDRKLWKSGLKVRPQSKPLPLTK